MKAYLLILFFCKYLALVHTQMVSYMTRMLRFKCQILGFILQFCFLFLYYHFFCLNAKYLALFSNKYNLIKGELAFKCQILGFIRMMLQNLKAMQHGLNAKYLALFTQMEVWFMLAILCLNAKYLALFQNIFFIYFRIFIV